MVDQAGSICSDRVRREPQVSKRPNPRIRAAKDRLEIHPLSANTEAYSR